MKLTNTILLLTYALGCLTCTRTDRPSAFFQPAGFDADSRMNSLDRKIGYMQSKLGLAIYDFEFVIPKDKNLMVTFKADLDGKLVPELSAIYHIPPTGNQRGWVSVSFFNPQYQTQPPQSPNWEVNVSSSGSLSSWTVTSPFVLTANQSRSTAVSTAGLSDLDDNQEHKVWEYRLSPVSAKDSKQAVFTYTVNIKLEQIVEGKGVEKIEREDLK
jgi:hypothetical protein